LPGRLGREVPWPEETHRWCHVSRDDGSVGAWTYGRGKLPFCGLPAMNPWTRAKRAPKGVVRG
jgi:hypothetical protein